MKHTYLAVLLCGSAICLRATPILIDTTATEVTHSYVPAAHSTVDYLYGGFWGAVAATSFSGSLSSSETFDLTLRAPAGSMFSISPPDGSFAGVLSFGMPLSMWIAPGWDGGLRYALPTSITFADYSGPSWYNDNIGVSVDTQGRALVIEGALWWSGAPQISFSSLTLSADLSQLSGFKFPDLTFAPDLAAVVAYQNVLGSANGGDPGASVRIVSTAVPDAGSTFALSLMVAGLLATGHRVLTRRYRQPR